jgi:predicted RNase H-like HicB family nuclease
MENLNYYMSLRYSIEVVEIPEDEGGGFILAIPELGRASVNAFGETYDEARAMLEEVKESAFSRWIENGISIPEPINEIQEESYSGRYPLRMPKFLHRQIAEFAKEEGQSINSLLVALITQAITEKMINSGAQKAIKDTIRECLQVDWPERHLVHHIAPEIKMTTLELDKEGESHAWAEKMTLVS